MYSAENVAGSHAKGDEKHRRGPQSLERLMFFLFLLLICPLEGRRGEGATVRNAAYAGALTKDLSKDKLVWSPADWMDLDRGEPEGFGVRDWVGDVASPNTFISLHWIRLTWVGV